MHITRKIRKAFDRDSLHSIYEHARRKLHPVDAGRIFAQLDSRAWMDLHQSYLQAPSPATARNSDKFADARYWIKVNIERAQDLRLNRPPPLRILDLGCGAGYFLFVSKCLGHEVLGLDVDDVPLYRQTTRLLDVPRVIARIEPGIPLPKLGGRFDLVTAHCICFQKVPSPEDGEWTQWGADPWRFFLHDVRSRLLTPAGRLLLDFNPRPHAPCYPSEVERLFRAEGARISRSKVLLSARPPAA